MSLVARSGKIHILLDRAISTKLVAIVVTFRRHRNLGLVNVVVVVVVVVIN